MNKEQVETYYNTFDQYQRGEISLQQWLGFCNVILEEIMEENKDVLIRLKEGV